MWMQLRTDYKYQSVLIKKPVWFSARQKSLSVLSHQHMNDMKTKELNLIENPRSPQDGYGQETSSQSEYYLNIINSTHGILINSKQRGLNVDN